jgi:protein TonB
MTALLAGGAGDFARGASDLRSSSRTQLRRGLAGSALLHLALLAVFLHATGGGEAIVRTYLKPADLVTIRPVPLLPPLVPPPVDGAPPISSDNGLIVPVIDPPNIPFKAIDPPEPGRTAIEGAVAGPPPNGREASPPGAPTEDSPLGVYRPVDELPVPVFAPKPEYPGWAREAGVTGRVLLNVLVGTDGRVRRVVIDRDENGLGGAAREALLTWVFRPARMNGAAVATWVAVPVVFRL